MAVRVLIDETGVGAGSTVGDHQLAALYAAPRTPWLRVNMVATLDGAAAGNDGRSGSINNAVDKRVFATLRGLADVIVVGAGTARAEGYRPAGRPIVLVSRRGHVPERLRGSEPGRVLMATCAAADGLDGARRLLGEEHVLVLGTEQVDLSALKGALAGRGLVDQLCEGGPELLGAMLDRGVADELALTTVPRLVGGVAPRIVSGGPLDAPAELALLLEEHGTLLARYLVHRTP